MCKGTLQIENSLEQDFLSNLKDTIWQLMDCSKERIKSLRESGNKLAGSPAVGGDIQEELMRMRFLSKSLDSLKIISTASESDQYL